MKYTVLISSWIIVAFIGTCLGTCAQKVFACKGGEPVRPTECQQCITDLLVCIQPWLKGAEGPDYRKMCEASTDKCIERNKCK